MADAPPSRRGTVASPCYDEWLYVRDYRRTDNNNQVYHFIVYYKEPGCQFTGCKYKTTCVNETTNIREGDRHHNNKYLFFDPNQEFLQPMLHPVLYPEIYEIGSRNTNVVVNGVVVRSYRNYES